MGDCHLLESMINSHSVPLGDYHPLFRGLALRTEYLGYHPQGDFPPLGKSDLEFLNGVLYPLPLFPQMFWLCCFFVFNCSKGYGLGTLITVNSEIESSLRLDPESVQNLTRLSLHDHMSAWLRITRPRLWIRWFLFSSHSLFTNCLKIHRANLT